MLAAAAANPALLGNHSTNSAYRVRPLSVSFFLLPHFLFFSFTGQWNADFSLE
jgi:hypothetical protein